MPKNKDDVKKVIIFAPSPESEKKVKVQPVIMEGTEKFYRKTFKKSTGAMGIILEQFRNYAEGNPTVRMFETPLDLLTWTLESNKAFQRTAKRTLKGFFTREELGVMIEIMNSTALTNGTPGDTLLGNIEDVLPEETSFGMDKPALVVMLRKFNALGIFERAYLELWAWGFWYSPGFDDRNGDLEGYIKTLI